MKTKYLITIKALGPSLNLPKNKMMAEFIKRVLRSMGVQIKSIEIAIVSSAEVLTPKYDL